MLTQLQQNVVEGAVSSGPDATVVADPRTSVMRAMRPQVPPPISY